MKHGDFSNLVDAQGTSDHHLRPGDRPRRERRVDARSVPGQHHSGRPHQPDARKRSCRTTRIPTARRRASRRGRTNLCYTEHFNKDLFWNWVGKVDHNFSEQRPRVLPLGQERAPRDPQHHRDPQRSGPERPAAADPRQRRVRRRLGARVRQRHGVQRAQQLHLLPRGAASSDDAFGFDVDAVGLAGRASSRSCRPRSSAACSRSSPSDHSCSCRAAFGPEHQQDLHGAAEHLDEPRQPQHPQRPRHALDERLHRRTTATPADRSTSPASFTRATLNSTSTSRATRSRRSCSARPRAATSPVNVLPHYTWTFVAPWVQDDWRISNKLTLNLGFRWDFNSPGQRSQQHAELRVRSDDRQPDLGGGRAAGDGRHHASSASTAHRTTPWKFDRNNWQPRAGAAYQLNEKTVLRAGYGKYFENPTGQSLYATASAWPPSLIGSNDGGRTPTYALSNPFPNGVQQPPGSVARAAHVPRTRAQLLEPGLRRAHTCISSRSAFSASCRGAWRSRRATSAAAPTI